MTASLIVYAATARGDAALREAVRAGGGLTVLTDARASGLRRRPVQRLQRRTGMTVAA